MSKRGSRTRRTAIWRAAVLACQHDAVTNRFAKHRTTMKQPLKVALSHVARKRVQAIYGVLRYHKPCNRDVFRGKAQNAA